MQRILVLLCSVYWYCYAAYSGIVMQRIVVFPYRCFGRVYGSHLNSNNFLPVKMGQIGSPETSVRNYYCTLRNIPVERRFHLLRNGSLESHIKFSFSS
jgi:hypothetical protein